MFTSKTQFNESQSKLNWSQTNRRCACGESVSTRLRRLGFAFVLRKFSIKFCSRTEIHGGELFFFVPTVESYCTLEPSKHSAKLTKKLSCEGSPNLKFSRIDWIVFTFSKNRNRLNVNGFSGLAWTADELGMDKLFTIYLDFDKNLNRIVLCLQVLQS